MQLRLLYVKISTILVSSKTGYGAEQIQGYTSISVRKYYIKRTENIVIYPANTLGGSKTIFL